jgi:uncharacterized protein (TIGR03067 family)
MFRNLLALALVAAVVAGVRADENDPEPPAKGRELLGNWTYARAIGDKGGPPGDLTLTFSRGKDGKGKVAVMIMGKPADKVHSFTTDPKKKPAHLDLTDDKGKKVAGIYKIEKGELFICIGERTGKRPTDFAGKDEPVIVLKRPAKK